MHSKFLLKTYGKRPGDTILTLKWNLRKQVKSSLINRQNFVYTTWGILIASYQTQLWYYKMKTFDTNVISYIGFYFSSDVVTKDEAVAMLKAMETGKEEREEQMKRVGYPAYTTQAGNYNLLWKYNSIALLILHLFD